MKKLLALGLACCLPTGLAAGDPAEAPTLALGTVSALVLDDSTPIARNVACVPSPARTADKPDCMAIQRALLTARIQKVSALRERGRWM